MSTQDAAPVHEPDPFEAFDHAQGIGSVRDPHSPLAELRAAGAVHDVSTDGQRAFKVVSFDGVQQVLRDGATFSSAGYAETMGIVMGHSILEMDEPEHHASRALVQQAFTRRAMQQWEEELVEPIVTRMVDAFVDDGRADLVEQLTFPFPVHVIAGMLGLPEEDLPLFHRWAVELISISVDPARGMAASAKLRDYFADVLEQRRREPLHDVISVLAHAEHDGERLDDEEIFAFLRLLLPAGAETTYRSSSNLLFGLLTHPEQLEALRNDRSLLPQAIEEGLRWEAPLTGISRRATVDVELAGVHIPAGASVSVSMASANRDESRWDRPDEFDIFREQKQHLAFAFGPHMCLGMHLARMETTVALNQVLDRLPGLRLDPAAEDVHISGEGFRAPPALPVLFDA